MIILGDNDFITDYPIGNMNQAVLTLARNKDLILNSMAYLVDREEDIIVRKANGNVAYTVTKQQDSIIKVVIFGVPGIIILAGIIVWIVRRRRK